MPRPVKRTAEYCAHYATESHDHICSILFNNFQHEGVSFYFQLQERVIGTNNHVIAIRNPEDLEYLASEMRFPTEKLKVMLLKLAEMNELDNELYMEGKIWWQDVVDRLQEVYNHRGQNLPIKPGLLGTLTPFLLPLTPFLLAENTQRKKESKESKESVAAEAAPPGQELPEKGDGEKTGNPVPGDERVPRRSNNPYIARMQLSLGFPETTKIDPVPNPGKEAMFIKKALDRGYTWDAIFDFWTKKVAARGEFVSMQWVNEDIGKVSANGKNGTGRLESSSGKGQVRTEPDNLHAGLGGAGAAIHNTGV